MTSSIPQSEQPGPRPPALQRRRVERVQAILDAAEELLSTEGYEAATLKGIGERAGIPTASVYHYFGDRHEVDAELLQRHLSDLDALVGTSLDNPELNTLPDVVDAIIDAYLAYFRWHPSLVELWFVGRSLPLSELGNAWDESQAEKFWRILIERGLIRANTPQRVVQLAVAAGDRLFDVAFRDSKTGDDATIDEARRLVTAYLATYAAPGR